MTDREAMKQALEALEWWEDDYGSSKDPSPVIIALRERLAQPEQEPLQFKCTIVDDAHPNGVPLRRWGKQPEQEPVHNVQSNGRHSPLLTHMMNKQTTPPQPQRKWVGSADLADSNAYLTPQHKGKHMTQEALKQALEALELNNSEWKDLADSGDSGYWKAEDQGHYQLTIEAITAIKEALAQKQEPAATVESVATVVSKSGNQEVTMSWWHEPALPVGTKLYTTPPQRTWVGLTDDEIEKILVPLMQDGMRISMRDFARAIEAKLREKNGGEA